MTKKQKRGLLILVTPFVLLVGTALLQVLVLFTAGPDSEGALRVVVNIFSLVAGLVAVVGMVPCLIIGILFLATGGEKTSSSTVHDGAQAPLTNADASPIPPAENQSGEV